MNSKLGPIFTKTNVINFMTKVGLRLGMLVNTASGLYVGIHPQILHLILSQIFFMPREIHVTQRGLHENASIILVLYLLLDCTCHFPGISPIILSIIYLYYVFLDIIQATE